MATAGAVTASAQPESFGTRLLIVLAYPLWGITYLWQRKWAVLSGYLGLVIVMFLAIWVESTWRIRNQVDRNHVLLYQAQHKWWQFFDKILIARPFDGLWHRLYPDPYYASNGDIFKGYLLLALLGGFVALVLVCLYHFILLLSSAFFGFPPRKAETFDFLKPQEAKKLVPVPLLEAPKLLDEAEDLGDVQSWQTIAEWGYQLIDREYGTASRWPGNRVRRRIAQNEWERLLHERNHTVLDEHVRLQTEEAIYSIRQRFEERRFQDAEKHREQQLMTNTKAEVLKAQAQEVARGEAEERIIQAKAQADIYVYKTKREINLAFGSGEKDHVAIVNMVNEKINAIEADPTIPDDRKHRMTTLWREALPMLIEHAGKQLEP